jgi:hypothetical protein
MRPDDDSPRLVTESSLAGYFRASVHQAVRNQKVEAKDATVVYLGDLLAEFSRADRLFQFTRDGAQMVPLAELYRQAVEAPSASERRLLLRGLGDVALFVSGLFSGWLGRRAAGIDYYVAMGESAYGYLSESEAGGAARRGLGSIFQELSRQFVRFVDVLAEVGERAPGAGEEDVLRLYDAWSRTGSARLERRLRRLGVSPLSGAWAH